MEIESAFAKMARYEKWWRIGCWLIYSPGIAFIIILAFAMEIAFALGRNPINPPAQTQTYNTPFWADPGTYAGVLLFLMVVAVTVGAVVRAIASYRVKLLAEQLPSNDAFFLAGEQFGAWDVVVADDEALELVQRRVPALFGRLVRRSLAVVLVGCVVVSLFQSISQALAFCLLFFAIIVPLMWYMADRRIRIENAGLVTLSTRLWPLPAHQSRLSVREGLQVRGLEERISFAKSGVSMFSITPGGHPSREWDHAARLRIEARRRLCGADAEVAWSDEDCDHDDHPSDGSENDDLSERHASSP